MFYISQKFTDSRTTIRVLSPNLDGVEKVASLLMSSTEVLKDSETIAAKKESDQRIQSIFCEVVLKNDTGLTTYLRFYAKHDTKINELKELFAGKNINGVLVKDVVVTSFKLVD